MKKFRICIEQFINEVIIAENEEAAFDIAYEMFSQNQPEGFLEELFEDEE